MFDMSFSEILVIALVALVVIGPEKLPKVARTLGFMLGRVQRYLSDARADLGREMELDELRRMREDFEIRASVFESEMRRKIARPAQEGQFETDLVAHAVSDEDSSQLSLDFSAPVSANQSARESSFHE
ncbi:MAG: Sec-independent protein translocase protein TatB [Proteobacteria bacterium]|nr:Sec-independent protein translocase protein TatB [Pseudomonadota bacterium]MDE3208197.1 twin-arginine translocase subunit TatB [Pseudomonadota bacterium]